MTSEFPRPIARAEILDVSCALGHAPELDAPPDIAGLEMAPVVVTPENAGGFNACFSHDLAARVAGEGEARSPNFNAFITEQLMGTVGGCRRMEFVFTRRSGPGAGPLVGLQIRGNASAPDGAAATREAQQFQATMRPIISGRHDLRFAPSVSKREALPFCYVVEHDGLLVTTQKRPVLAGTEPLPVVLPAINLIEARVPLWEALLTCPWNLRIVLRVTRLRLDEAQLAAITVARAALEGGYARCAHLPERNWSGRERAKIADRYTIQQLERWIEVPRGLAMAIEIESPHRLEPAALRWIAQPLMPWRKIQILPKSEQMSASFGAGLDLRAAFNESATFPALLPPRDLLERLGFPQSYSGPRFELADEGVILGAVAGRNVRFPNRDRSRHCYVVGATGCGKTTLLLNMILQDIHAGEGVCVIDPHGDLFQDALNAIPRHRAKDVITLDPTNFQRAVGLNYLETSRARDAMESNFIVNEMLKIFDKLYDMRECGGPLFQTYMRNALLLLMESRIEGLTLLEIPALFEDRDYRRHLVAHCTNRDVARFWRGIAEKADGDHSLANLAPYIVSKLNQFTSNALIRGIVGQSRSTLDLRRVLDERKILLVNLAKGLLGESDSALLGMMITSKLFAAALSRAQVERNERPPFNLFVDEFQNFTTDTLAHLLSEGRKFGLRAVLANQHLTQIDVGHGSGNLMKAVLGNVGTILAMRVGAADAEILPAVIGGTVTSRLLQDLPDYHVAARLLQDGRPVHPFVFKTLPSQPLGTDAASRRAIRQAYIRKYTRPISVVEREIASRRTTPDEPPVKTAV
jgi:hypothetical protein